MAEQSQPAAADRRTVLRTTALGVAVAGVGVTAAACSSSNSTAQGSTAQTAAGGSSSTVASSKVPVDGGYIDTTNNVVVTQPSAGEYKAFTAICTHQGCTVSSVQNNVIQCPCHGSQFSAKDGSVITGPATSPLASKTVTVAGSTITYGA
ncbi:Rieske (2Fe-2S) protein [Actinospica sp. MGRD01-02]|uniref:Cytochrome bc1 complex Rieske iron-sulfur subunit n=1 Tax=Actinospica acidithermotolerans TaxID=2828514 RepID=A0A941ECA0_9ACTN|nr:Rieske (2Fe-2S) protein [Actinospica acidithermotolerans]MBR7825229.1 Rieske (2Fe-2S) protein [Actinospica acidithermotolerans]